MLTHITPMISKVSVPNILHAKTSPVTCHLAQCRHGSCSNLSRRKLLPLLSFTMKLGFFLCRLLSLRIEERAEFELGSWSDLCGENPPHWKRSTVPSRKEKEKESEAALSCSDFPLRIELLLSWVKIHTCDICRVAVFPAAAVSSFPASTHSGLSHKDGLFYLTGAWTLREQEVIICSGMLSWDTEILVRKL